jgi:hypothetical protein
MRITSWLAKDLSASQQELCSTESVTHMWSQVAQRDDRNTSLTNGEKVVAILHWIYLLLRTFLHARYKTNSSENTAHVSHMSHGTQQYVVLCFVRCRQTAGPNRLLGLAHILRPTGPALRELLGVLDPKAEGNTMARNFHNYLPIQTA